MKTLIALVVAVVVAGAAGALAADGNPADAPSDAATTVKGSKSNTSERSAIPPPAGDPDAAPAGEKVKGSKSNSSERSSVKSGKSNSSD